MGTATRNVSGMPSGFAVRGAVFLSYVVWCAVVIWAVDDAVRHNDQAAYINGGLQIAQGEKLPWHAALFNYDKEFGSYWLIAGVLRILGFGAAVLVTNYAQAMAFCLSLGALVYFRLWRLSLFVILPLALCPVLVLSVPFMGTGMISLTFLLLGFAIMRRGNLLRQCLGCLFIVVAAASRADAVLAVPALILCEISRRNFRGLVTSPFAWTISVCGILPPVLGLLLTPNSSETFLSPALPKVVAAFVIFGLGVMVLALLAWSGLFFLAVGIQKTRWRVFYTFRALSPLIPFGFYMPQMTSPQQLLLTLACYLFTVSDRRALVAFAWLINPRSLGQKLIRVAILLPVIVPWFVGLKASSLTKIRPTTSFPQDFPTAHGHYPMGAYAFYLVHGRTHRYILDHNQKIFLAAKRIRYQPCNGKVSILRTPMYNYLELAVRLEGLSPEITDVPKEVNCHIYGYADARSLIRNQVARSGDLLHRASLVSSSYGQAILELGRSETDLGILLDALHDRFSGREFEFYQEAADSPFELKSGANGRVLYALSRGECAITPDGFGNANIRELDGARIYLWTVPDGYGSGVVNITCSSKGQAGQVTLVLPAWMGQ
jgi:hypothetical protein